MRFQNQTFTTDITLDYNEFIDCEIRDCVVFFHGGNFALDGTQLKNVRFGLSGAANSTLALLRLLRASDPLIVNRLLEPDAELRTDNTITIN